MKKLLLLVIALVMVVSLVACGNAAKSEGAETAVQESAEKAETTSEEKGLIGVAMPNKATMRWITEGNLIKEELEAKGYTVDLQYSENDVNTQVNQVENMVAKGAKLLIIAAVDGESLTTVLKTAASQGTKVIAYERMLMNTENVDYFCTFDNILVGAMQAQYIVDTLGVDKSNEPFTIEIFAGSLDDTVAHYNYDGAMEVLTPYIESGKLVVKSGQTTIAETATQSWAAETAQARMDNLLSGFYANEDIDAVLCPYDGMSIGIVSSLTAVGYGTAEKPMPIVTGQDGEIPSLKSIIAGGQSMTVYKIVTDLAEKAVEMSLSILEGADVEISDNETYTNGVKTIPTYLVPCVVVTAENIQEVVVDSGLVAAEDLK